MENIPRTATARKPLQGGPDDRGLSIFYLLFFICRAALVTSVYVSISYFLFFYLQGGTDDRSLSIQDGIAARIWQEESSGNSTNILSDLVDKAHIQGIPVNFTLMPELLKSAGYSTHGYGM